MTTAPRTTVLITGANRGIGLALTDVFARRGDTVLACCRVPAEAKALQVLSKQHAVTVLALTVNSDASVSELARQLADTTVDVLINNAGIIGQPGERQTATSMDFSIWSELFEINTMGPVRVLQALLPHLKRSASPKVMNITSDLGALSHDDPIFHGYSASKAALNKFMRLAAIDLKTQRIAIGLVHPGWVHTDMGGPKAPIAPATSAAGIAQVIDRLSLDNTGGFWRWDGTPHEW